MFDFELRNANFEFERKESGDRMQNPGEEVPKLTSSELPAL
jgi:hypothetical protein